jgi:hypothetical protein
MQQQEPVRRATVGSAKQFLQRRWYQKQPWTKTTVLYLGKTMSTETERDFRAEGWRLKAKGGMGIRTWMRKRNPILWRRERTRRSGVVFLPRMRDMFQLRRSLDNRSFNFNLILERTDSPLPPNSSRAINFCVRGSPPFNPEVGKAPPPPDVFDSPSQTLQEFSSADLQKEAISTSLRRPVRCWRQTARRRPAPVPQKRRIKTNPAGNQLVVRLTHP